MPWTDPFVPQRSSRLVGSAIAALSPRTFARQFIDTGRVEVDEDGIVTASLARALNRKITHETYCRALVATEPERRRSRAAMRAHKRITP
jgi:hypothetical protein